MLWLNTDTGGTFTNARQRIDCDRNPCISVTANGLGPGKGKHWLEDDGQPSIIATTDKPPYRVPSMEEINAIPWNGFNAISTFSGCGGSCLGYRMAGFKVVWANEFVPAAQDSYNANKTDDSYLDPRDIRLVQPDEILKRLKMNPGELDLFDGSPPCQAFSTAGKRKKNWGKLKEYEHGAKQCNERLFDEYIRLLRGLKPKVFVAENVSGLIKGTAKGMFLDILRDLKASGYRVKCKLLDAQWLGVPQMRQRTIFIGVREDLGLDPVYPKPLKYRYSVRDALPWITKLTLGDPSHHRNPGCNFERGVEIDVTTQPCRTVKQSTAGISGNGHSVEAVIHDTGGTHASKEPITSIPCPAITIGDGDANSTHYLIAGKGEADTITGRKPDGIERRKFTIAELKRICGFPDDFILKGSYAQQWERLGNSVPPVMMHKIAEVIRDELLAVQPSALSPQTA